MGNLTRAAVIAANLRKAEEMKLRLAGMDFREIRDAMIQKYGRDALPGSYDERYVWRDVHERLVALRASSLDTANDLRIMEAQRLDQLQLALMPRALNGDYKSIDRVLKIMEMRAKLFGLNAPTQVKMNDWRTEILDLIRTGVITKEQVETEIGTELTQQLLESGSDGAIEGRFTEEKDSDDSQDSL